MRKAPTKEWRHGRIENCTRRREIATGEEIMATYWESDVSSRGEGSGIARNKAPYRNGGESDGEPHQDTIKREKGEIGGVAANPTKGMAKEMG